MSSLASQRYSDRKLPAKGSKDLNTLLKRFLKNRCITIRLSNQSTTLGQNWHSHLRSDFFLLMQWWKCSALQPYSLQMSVIQKEGRQLLINDDADYTNWGSNGYSLCYTMSLSLSKG